jgi:TPR repeat protein
MHIVKQSLIPLMIAVLVCQVGVSQSEPGEHAASSELSVERRARNGDPEAQDEMGLAAEERHEYAEALKWFRLAAQQGLSKSQVKVGYYYNEGLGAPKDHVEAFRWYTLAAAQGDPQAEFDLAMCYHQREGVQSNRAAAIKWFSSALNHGYAKAANGLGLVYEFGPTSDYEEALRWYRKGAELGDEDAQYSACRLTVQGLGTPRDYSEAFHWCSEAADGDESGGSSWGQFGLGRLYENGFGVKQDYAEAVEWYRKSADQGNPAAQMSLGELYSKGNGVKRDLIEAYMWIAVAGSLGHPDAVEKLQSLGSKMKNVDLSQAQARARGWIAQHPPDGEDNPAENILYHYK